MCYHERISPYWFRLWAKAALLTGRQNVLRGQYFTRLACSLYHWGRVFFWAVYNNTCALYFPQINGNARWEGGGGSKQDGCHRQVNLSTAEQRQDPHRPPPTPTPFTKNETRSIAFPSARLWRPSVVPYWASNLHPKLWVFFNSPFNSLLHWER